MIDYLRICALRQRFKLISKTFFSGIIAVKLTIVNLRTITCTLSLKQVFRIDPNHKTRDKNFKTKD